MGVAARLLRSLRTQRPFERVVCMSFLTNFMISKRSLVCAVVRPSAGEAEEVVI